MAKNRGYGEGTIYQRKDGRWAAQMAVGLCPDGKPRRLSFAGRTRREVQEKLTAALAEKQRGSFVEPSNMTVAEWLGTWLNEYKKNRIRPTTWDSYEVQVRCHIVPTVGSMKLKDLRPEHLQRLYNSKLSSGLAARSVRYVHQVIHGALDQAVKNQLIVRNVSDMAVLPSECRKEIRPLTADQANHLMTSVKNDRLYPAILLGLETGLRRGELLALRWADLDLDDATLSVSRGLVRVRSHEAGKRTTLVFQDPKTVASRRTIPIPAEALSELKGHKERQTKEKLILGGAYFNNDLVFCTEDGRPIDPRNFVRHFDRLVKAAGLPPIRFHDVRHTFATMMLELGQSPKVVQTILGHSRISVTLDLYSHVSLDLERQSTSVLDNALRQRLANSCENQQ